MPQKLKPDFAVECPKKKLIALIIFCILPEKNAMNCFIESTILGKIIK
jgi:hypothetical protein